MKNNTQYNYDFLKILYNPLKQKIGCFVTDIKINENKKIQLV